MRGYAAEERRGRGARIRRGMRRSVGEKRGAYRLGRREAIRRGNKEGQHLAGRSEKRYGECMPPGCHVGAGVEEAA